ncbi:MAG: hypothetical protein KC553_14860 [Nitrospina sp.]|nr:hypothetical protein [Nitrospina sp.]
MKLVINGEEIREPIAETTLGPLIDRLMSERQALGLHVFAVHLNSDEVLVDSEEARSLSLSGDDLLEIEFAPIEALIARNIDNAGNYLDRLLPGFEKATQLFRTGNEQEANRYFLDIIDGIEWFSEVVTQTLAATGGDPATLKLGTETLQDRNERLLSYTTQMVEANQNRDWVLLADLIEYELTPFYEEWQTLLPHLLPPKNIN